MKRMFLSTAVLALGGTGLVAGATSAQAAPATGVYYASCPEAIAVHAAPIYMGEPGYRLKLDHDHDGVACDTNLPKGYVKHAPAPVKPAPVTSSKPAPVVTPPAKPTPGQPAPGTPKPVGPVKPAPGTAKPLPVVAPPTTPGSTSTPSAPTGPKVSTDLVTPKQDGRNTGAALLTAGALAGLGAVRLRAGKR